MKNMQKSREQESENNLFDGHYKLLRPLSTDGGTADVWLAVDTNTIDSSVKLEEDSSDTESLNRDAGVLVAIKIYRPKNALDIDGEQRFRDEFKIVHECRHENLLQPSGFSIFNGIPYLVLPYCENGSSEQLIGKQLSSADIWKFILDVSSGLNRLHTNKTPIIHQDIKPANILIDNNNNYVITDFGISSKRGGRDGFYYDEENSGTMAYMAPERFHEDAAPMSQSDIWAFGATLYEILSGRVPFGEEGGKSQLDNQRPLTPISDIPTDIQRLISDCLALEPGNRPSAKMIKEAAIAKLYPIKSHRKHIHLLGIGLVAVIAVVAIFFIYRNPKTIEPRLVDTSMGDSIADADSIVAADSINKSDSIHSIQEQKIHDTIYISRSKPVDESDKVNDGSPKQSSGNTEVKLREGVYKQTRYQAEGMPIQDNPFEVYKIVKSIGTVQMEFLRLNPLNFIIFPVNVALEDVLESTESSFDYRWVCNIQNHKTIAFGTPVREHYDTKFKDVANLPRLFRALSGRVPTSDTSLIGVWRRNDSSAYHEYYKVYTSEYCYTIEMVRNREDTRKIEKAYGWQLSVQYLSDDETIENGNSCQINWTNSTSYDLTYLSNGNAMTESWEISTLPSDFTYWFK